MDKTLLIIGLVWPEPNSSAAGKRMLQLITLFKKWGYSITFASSALENEFNFDLETIDVQKKSIVLNCASFDFFIKDLNPSIVLFDRFVIEEQFSWRVSIVCPNAVKILDSEDLHCLRYTRHANFKKGIAFEIENLYTEDLTKRELASIYRCDLTLVVAEFEMKILCDYFKIDSQILFYLPILFQKEELEIDFSTVDFHKRQDFVFIGNFWHEPNWDAVLYLKTTIWPLVRIQCSKAIIRIYGAYPSQKVFDLHNKKDGFLVLGRAANAEKVIAEARVLIAPLRFGAGIKGKLLESMLWGTPSITTSIGAESIQGALDWNGFITDDPIEIASKAVLLYENESIWTEALNNGHTILSKRFLASDFELPFKQKLEAILFDIFVHRKYNFIGALLSHHSMRSTEYMARWIEEKNNK